MFHIQIFISFECIVAADLYAQKIALQETFIIPGDPIELELYQIAALADQADQSQTSVTVTALFLPKSDRLDEVRGEICSNTIYPFIESSKTLNIIHSSLARLIQLPGEVNDNIPLLKTLSGINQHLMHLPSEQKHLTLIEFDLISTTRSLGGFYAADYVTVGVPISLVDPNPLSIRCKSIKPTLQSSARALE